MVGGLPDSLVPGTVLTYSCDPGHKLQDLLGETVVCGPSGNWSRPVARCRHVMCQSLTVRNGKAVMGGTSYGEIANYKCRKGHYLLGPHNSTCSEVGAWEPPPPTCVPVDCGQPPDVSHGGVSYGQTTYRHTATYSCRSGYILRGSQVRHCTSSGIWSKREPR